VFDKYKHSIGYCFSLMVSAQAIPFNTSLTEASSRARSVATPLVSGIDTFSRFETTQNTIASPGGWANLRYKADFEAFKQYVSQSAGGETAPMQLAMAKAVYLAVSPRAKIQFKRLLQQGSLFDISTENRHSTLYQLHQRLVQPVISGFQPAKLVEQYLNLLDRPYVVSQKPSPLGNSYSNAMMDVEKNPIILGKLRKTVYVQRPHTRQTLNIKASYDCTASAVMFGMLEQQPSEIIRQLNGLTSPLRSFTKTVRLTDLDPTHPEAAIKRLTEQHVPFERSGEGMIKIRVTAPEQVVLRALNDVTHQNGNPRYRDAMQTLYQMTLVELADPNGYDEADGRMVAPDGTDPGGGLPGDLIDMMSSLIEGRGGTGSVTVQQMDSRSNDAEQRPYLLGYALPFDYTLSLLVQALGKGVMPMVGIVYLDDEGGYEGGHYIRLAGTYVDPKTHERQFVVADSDDGLPTTITMSARKLIPMINRLHLSATDAQETNQLIEQFTKKSQAFITDETDAAKYDVLPIYQQTTNADSNTVKTNSPITNSQKTVPIKNGQRPQAKK
jgi:hypothetical protein